MKTSKSILTILVINLGLFTSNLNAQFSVTGQYMSRGEYRHGYQSLADTNQKAAVFVSQRARINAEYKHEKYKIYVSAQDIRTWGSVANAAIDTKGLFSIFEAYGELNCTKKFSAKIGRQVISYDDDRIFGGLDWAMQARRHDAAIFKYNVDSTMTIHVGGAYNQNSESHKLIQYSVAGNYKSFQYLWMNKQIKKVSLSFLALNNGVAYNRVNTTTGVRDSMTLYQQTAGLRAEYKGDKLIGLVYGYYQMGDDASNRKTSAMDVCGEIGYKPVKGLLVSLGAEYLTGQSQTDTAKAYRDINHAFNPYYGTNHRFNGYMDYFYVGNHINSVGLLDAYLRLSYTYKKALFSVNTHMFNSAAAVRDKSVTTAIESMNANLGTEVDFTFSYKFTDGVAVQGGYSQMFGTTTLKAIKGGQTSEISNWAYLSLIIRPGKIAWPKCGLKM
ncbi:MAG: hypothetical protein IPM51_01575 [Sphingobacteriaceae bacterium]|nr:hypothetical protein [Sphingobacteriaceae bacterium]